MRVARDRAEDKRLAEIETEEALRKDTWVHTCDNACLGWFCAGGLDLGDVWSWFVS